MNSKESKARMWFLIVQVAAAAVMTVFFVVPRLDSNDILDFALQKAMIVIAFISSVAVFVETKKGRLPISLSMISMIVGAIVVLFSLAYFIVDYVLCVNNTDSWYYCQNLFMPSCSIAMVVLAIVELKQKQQPASQQSGMYEANVQQPVMSMSNGMYGTNMHQPTMPMNNGMYIDPTRDPLPPINSVYDNSTMTYQNNNQNNNT